jgi:hypothetical protein
VVVPQQAGAGGAPGPGPALAAALGAALGQANWQAQAKAGAAGGLPAALIPPLGVQPGLVGGQLQQDAPWVSCAQYPIILGQLGLSPGIFSEVATTDSDSAGNVDGAAVFKVLAIVSNDAIGVLCEVVYGGASSIPRGIALDSTLLGCNNGFAHALLRICATVSTGRGLAPQGRSVYHVETLRARAPQNMVDPWIKTSFALPPPPGPSAGSAQGAGRVAQTGVSAPRSGSGGGADRASGPRVGKSIRERVEELAWDLEVLEPAKSCGQLWQAGASAEEQTTTSQKIGVLFLG